MRTGDAARFARPPAFVSELGLVERELDFGFDAQLGRALGFGAGAQLVREIHGIGLDGPGSAIGCAWLVGVGPGLRAAVISH